jgi:hypothetical protein
VQSKWKNRWKTIGIEDKLDEISQLEKGEQIVDIVIMLDVLSSVCTINVMPIELKEVLGIR